MLTPQGERVITWFIMFSWLTIGPLFYYFDRLGRKIVTKEIGKDPGPSLRGGHIPTGMWHTKYKWGLWVTLLWVVLGLGIKSYFKEEAPRQTVPTAQPSGIVDVPKK